MSKQVISLAPTFHDIQVPAVSETFKTRRDVLLRMTGSEYDCASKKEPIVIVYHDPTQKNEGPLSTILFLDNPRSGLYSLSTYGKYILVSDNAPAAPVDDLNQPRHVFNFNPANRTYSYIGLFESIANFVGKHLSLWGIKH